MKKTIAFVVSISIAASVGFIVGFQFYSEYKVDQRDLVLMTLKQTSDLQNLSHSYQQLKNAKQVVNDLNSVSNMDDLEKLKVSYSNILNTHIESYENITAKAKRGTTTTYIFEPVDNQVNKIKAEQ